MIKINHFIKLAPLILLAISPISNAEQLCQLNDKPTIDESKRYIQCLDTELNKAKQVQGTWIQKRKYEIKQLEQSSGNTQVLMLFMRSIDNNEKFIKSACQWRYILKLPNTKAAAINYKLCEIKLINQFTDSLKVPF